MFANNFYILLGIVCCLQQLNVNAYPTINIRRLFDSAIEGRYKKSDINFPQPDEDVLELDHLKHEEQQQPSIADESIEGGDIHFEIPSVNAAEHPVAAIPASPSESAAGVGAGAAEDTPINPTDLLPELEQQLEEMTTAKTSTINNAAAGQREGEQTPEGVSHHRPPMLPHHDGGKVGSSQQQQAPVQTPGGGTNNEESIGTVEGNVNSPLLTKPFYGAARLAFGQNPEVPSTTTSTSTTTTTTVPTTIITSSPTTNENIPESIITSPPSAQSIETSGVQPPSTSDDDGGDSNPNKNKEHQVNPPSSPTASGEHNNSNLSPSSTSASSSVLTTNSNEKEQLGDTFVPQMEATKPGPERRSLNVMPLKTAENLLKHKDGQYSSFDMAQYVFWTGDEAGVARAVEEFIEQGLMSRENAIKFLRDIRLGIEYLQSSYANRVFPDQLRDNFIKKHSHNSNPMQTQAPATTTSTTTAAPTTTRRPVPLTTERTSSVIAREYSSAAAGGGVAPGSGHKMVLNHHLDKTMESMPSLMRLQDANNVHHDRERSEHDEAAGRAKIAKFLYTEFSLEEVIYQLGKVMFSESLAHGSDQAQQELQRLTDFLEEEGRQGMISPELQKKVLDVLLQALSDTLVEHPELLAAARANLGSSFEKLPTNSLESKN
ncbi:mucin-2 isoform X2 [Eupeodes corollae]|nr:mucin-2 isoform X2 [Eupeodes corollae]